MTLSRDSTPLESRDLPRSLIQKFTGGKRDFSDHLLCMGELGIFQQVMRAYDRSTPDLLITQLRLTPQNQRTIQIFDCSLRTR